MTIKILHNGASVVGNNKHGNAEKGRMRGKGQEMSLAKIGCLHMDGHRTSCGVGLQYFNCLRFEEPVKVVQVEADYPAVISNPAIL